MTSKLIEKTEVESGQDATLKIERIVLSKYAVGLLRAQPAAKGERRTESDGSQDERAPLDQSRPVVSAAR